MIFVIGGYAQGKHEYVKKRFGAYDKEIIDINDFIIKAMDSDKDIEKELNTLIKAHPNAIIISDEVGNGIVPVDKNERMKREIIGRMQCLLAEQAEEVIRVVCGIGQKIK